MKRRARGERGRAAHEGAERRRAGRVDGDPMATAVGRGPDDVARLGEVGHVEHPPAEPLEEEP